MSAFHLSELVGQNDLFVKGHLDNKVMQERMLVNASPSNFFKIERAIFRVIIFQDFAAASLQN